MQDWESRLSSELMTYRITAGGKFEKSEFARLLKMHDVAILVVKFPMTIFGNFNS